MTTTRSLLVVAILSLVATSSAFGSNAKVFIFAAPVGTTADFLGGFVPVALRDSVEDFRREIRGIRGIAFTTHREDALFVVQALSREEVNGEYRLSAHVTSEGREADLMGTSTHQWKQCAEQILRQIASWAKAHQAELQKARDAKK
jgi:hypothetical protein